MVASPGEHSSRASVVVAHGLTPCGSQAYLLHGKEDLSRPGIEPMSPALQVGLLTTDHQGSIGLALDSPACPRFPVFCLSCDLNET